MLIVSYLTNVLKAFADDTRLRLLNLLQHYDLCVCVVDEGDTEEEIAELRQKASRQLEELGESCSISCPEVKVRIETGIPSKHIKAIADEEDITLIVQGMRGKGGVEGLVLGSTAETVACTSNRPVLLIPAKK